MAPPKESSAATAAADKKKKKDNAAARKAKKKANEEAAEAARTAKKEALQAELGEGSFNLLAEEVFDVDTYTFNYRVEKPSTNPHLTVWALINALKGCSYKGHEAIDPDKTPRKLEFRTKRSKDKIEGDAYAVNFTSKQNCDAMLRHLYGEEREGTDCCEKCTKGTGALKGCVVAPGSQSCGNCDWNRTTCSLADKSPHKHKRKAGGDDLDEDDDDGNISDPFEELDIRTCKVLVGVFRAAIDRKKKQKTKK